MQQSHPSSFSAQVVQRQTVGDDIVVLDLMAPDHSLLPAFTAGAHIELQASQGPRHYSLCGSPLQRDRYRIAIHRVSQGRGGSRELFDSCQIGQRLTLSGPFNHFEMVASQAPALLIAGGIGITPLLAMAQQCAAQGRPFALHYTGRTLGRMAFCADMTSGPLAAFAQLYADDGDGAPAIDLASTIGRPLPGQQLYVCGPAGMIQAVRDTAQAQGWLQAQVHFEHFGGQATAPRADDGSFEVQLAKSGQCIRVDAGQTVAQALQQAGVHISVSCGAGVCGACRTRVLAGLPDHRDLFYTPEEQARGDEFTPCCSRSLSPRLVLDL